LGLVPADGVEGVGLVRWVLACPARSSSCRHRSSAWLSWV
jgi:hypothetical protein